MEWQPGEKREGGGGGEKATRAGYVALVGRPNAGKSTLLNALVGERLSIVSPKAQTTWSRVTGIRTMGSAQLIFLDTPGILDSGELIHRSLNLSVEGAVSDADVLCVVVDAARRLSDVEMDRLRTLLSGSNVPEVVAANKIDLVPAEGREERIRELEATFGVPVLPVSATKGGGTDRLLEFFAAALPEGPHLYPPDEVATEPVRFFVSELVRETVFERFRDEIPYSVFARVEDFREGGERTYIQVTLYVERASQKGILIGEKGAAIRELGKEARRKVEHFLGEPVYLELWVKVLPRWRKKKGELRRFGLPIPPDLPGTHGG